jgi:thioredoxin 1
MSKQLVYFSAPWCQPCKVFGPVVQKFAEDNPGLELLKVDIDSTPQIAIEYSVSSIPVLVLLDNGSEVNRIKGAKPRPFLDKELQPLI